MKKQTNSRSQEQVIKIEFRVYLQLLERIKIGQNQFIVCLLLSCLAHSSPLFTHQVLESSFELWFYGKGEYMQYWFSQFQRAVLHYLHLLCLYFSRKFQCTNDMMFLWQKFLLRLSIMSHNRFLLQMSYLGKQH